MNVVSDAVAPVPAGPDPAHEPLPADDRAAAFARLAPRDKAALLRACVPQILSLAPEMVSRACAAAGVDPGSPLAGAAWLSGPVALVANVRRYAEALEDIAVTGRPWLPLRALRGRLEKRVLARLTPGSFAERFQGRHAEVLVLFAEGVPPEEVLALQASTYRQPSAAPRTVVATDPLRALEALLVDGAVTTLEAADPFIERALAPLSDAGFLRVVQGTRAPSVARGAVIVLPALYARDELASIARRLVSELAAGAAFGMPAPSTFLVGECWLQRGAFVDALQGALAALPPLVHAPRLVVDAEPSPGEVAVRGVGCADAIEVLAAATDRCNALGPASVEIVAHPVQEEDAETAAALDRAFLGLRCDVLGINEWPAMLAYRGDAPGGPRMLARVDKAILRAPLEPRRRALYSLDQPRGARRGAPLADFHASPSLAKLLRSS